MDPVSNANRIAMLLRQRLQERSKAAGSGRAGRADARREAAKKGAVRGPDAIEGLDDRRLKRALIEDVLTDQFGAALVNDAKFQQVVDRVTETIEDDANGAATFAKVIADLRNGPA
jgi:hypothetical protein